MAEWPTLSEKKGGVEPLAATRIIRLQMQMPAPQKTRSFTASIMGQLPRPLHLSTISCEMYHQLRWDPYDVLRPTDDCPSKSYDATSDPSFAIPSLVSLSAARSSMSEAI